LLDVSEPFAFGYNGYNFDANEVIYHRKKITAKEIVLGNKVAVPASGRHLVTVLQKNAPHNESEKASN